MALAVPQQWTAFGGRDDVALTVNPTADNWLIAIIAYRTVDGTSPLATVGDLARNYWRLCGSASNPASSTRVEVWACPKVRYTPWAHDVIYTAVSHLNADDLGSVAISVVEVSGFVNGFIDVVSVTPGTASGTSLAINLPNPGVNCMVIAAAATDNNGVAITTPGAGWTALTAVQRTGPDLKVTPVWRSTSSAQTATWTSPSPLLWTGVVVAIRETGTVWAQPNPNWPATKLQLGHTVGLETPLPHVTWTDYTSRFEALRASRGVQYELGKAQSGEATLTLRNFDDALTPAPGGLIDIYTPYQLLMAWAGKIYPASSGWLERYPRRFADAHHAYLDAVAVDVIGTMVQESPSPVRGETFRHRPYAYWPLSDPAGSPNAINISGRSTSLLTMQRSKYGPGSGDADFGGSTEGEFVTTGIRGDSGTGWKQSGLVNADLDTGYCLIGTDPNFPAISGGVTICGITRIPADATSPFLDGTIFIIRNLDPGGGVSLGSVLKLSFDLTTGHSQITVWDKDTGAATTTLGSYYFHQGFVGWSVRFNRTSWRVDHQGITNSFSGSADLAANWDSISLGGEADSFWDGNCVNGTFAHIAVYDRWLSDGAIEQWTRFARIGWSNAESFDRRLQRRLALAETRMPRMLNFSDVVGAKDDPAAVSVSQAAGEIADNDNGMVYADAAGYLTFRSQRTSHRQSVTWTLGDNTAGGEIPFLPEIQPAYDVTHLYNTVRTENTGEYPGYLTAAVSRVMVDSDSISRYGAKPLTRELRHYDPQGAFSMAEWLLAFHREPKHRIAQVTVDAASYPAAWPFVLGIEVGDLVTIVRRPIGQPTLTVRCRVMQVAAELASGIGQTRGKVTLTLAAAPPQAIVLGDPVKGVLGDSTIGW